MWKLLAVLDFVLEYIYPLVLIVTIIVCIVEKVYILAIMEAVVLMREMINRIKRRKNI